MRRIGSGHFLAAAAALAAGLVSSTSLFAQTPQQPTLLQQLSEDTQRVYENTRGSLIRVQLPTPQWLEQINEREKFLRKWGTQLNPEVLQQLQKEQETARAEEYRQVAAASSTQPAVSTTQMSAPSTTQSSETNGLQFPLGHSMPEDPGNLVLVVTGLMYDNDGHAVVPLYVERKLIGNVPLRVLMGNGEVTSAKFVGSDRHTHLTVLQLENHNGPPATLSPRRPEDGVLTLVVAPEGGSRLVVWTNAHPEQGLVLMADGSVGGFGFEGGFLGAAECKPIVDQIIATGEVHRAVLGVMVREVHKDDVLRQSLPALGSRPAIRVLRVDANSAAQRGGLRAGDLILAIADQPVGDAPTFAAVIATRRGKTDLQVLRGDAVQTFNVDLQP